jgi:hypothetical protein
MSNVATVFPVFAMSVTFLVVEENEKLNVKRKKNIVPVRRVALF